MASVDLVHWTLETLAANWNDSAADFPVLVHKGDSQLYTRSETGLTMVGDNLGVNAGEVSNHYDLTRDNALTVGSDPDRITSPVGTEYDHSVEDGVSILIEGVRESKYGHVADAQDFKTLYEEALRALLVERSYPLVDEDAGVAYHSLKVENQTNRSISNRDYFGYQFDLLFDGYETLP